MSLVVVVLIGLFWRLAGVCWVGGEERESARAFEKAVFPIPHPTGL